MCQIIASKKKKFLRNARRCQSVYIMTMLSSKSNEEIRWMLDDYGVKHGPVVDSTRALYEKKLREAMAKHRKTKAQSDRTFHREEEDVTYIQHRRPQRYDDVSNREMDYMDGPAMYRTQAAYSNTSQARIMPENDSTPENGSRRLVPIWLQILVFLIISGFLYLFFINMEPAEPVKRLT